MLKKTLSVIAGLIAANLIISKGETIIFNKFPALGQFDAINNGTIAAQKLQDIPDLAWYYLFVVWIIAAFVCGFLIKLISHSSKQILPIICGGFLTMAAVLKFFERPHPIWVVIVGILVFIPFTFLGDISCKVHTLSAEEEALEEEKDLS
jgi:hypothetical protein